MKFLYIPLLALLTTSCASLDFHSKNANLVKVDSIPESYQDAYKINLCRIYVDAGRETTFDLFVNQKHQMSINSPALPGFKSKVLIASKTFPEAVVIQTKKGTVARIEKSGLDAKEIFIVIDGKTNSRTFIPLLIVNIYSSSGKFTVNSVTKESYNQECGLMPDVKYINTGYDF
jgi:hypothetical protein